MGSGKDQWENQQKEINKIDNKKLFYLGDFLPYKDDH